MFNVSVTRDLSDNTWDQVFRMLERYEQEAQIQERQDEYEGLVKLHRDARYMKYSILEMTSSLIWHPPRVSEKGG